MTIETFQSSTSTRLSLDSYLLHDAAHAYRLAAAAVQQPSMTSWVRFFADLPNLCHVQEGPAGLVSPASNVM